MTTADDAQTGPSDPLADWERELICQHCGSSCCRRCDAASTADERRAAVLGLEEIVKRIEALIEFEKDGDRWDSVTVLMQVRDWLAQR